MVRELGNGGESLTIVILLLCRHALRGTNHPNQERVTLHVLHDPLHVSLHVLLPVYTETMQKTCRHCGQAVKRAGLCAGCRVERRKKQWRDASQKYRDQGRRTAVSVSQEMLKAAHQHGIEIRLIPDKPIPGKLTPRGPDEGCSTTNKKLAGELDELARAAYTHPWWEENPDVFAGL
jgi:hypothetical protein